MADYDRELIASMLDAAVRGNSGYTPDAMTRQAELLRAADSVFASGSADAMHWIDRYAAGWDAECQLDRVADALLSRTPDSAAPDGGGVEQMARELLQRLMDAPYGDTTAGNMICAEALFDRLEAAWLPVITAALRQPAQVSAVVDSSDGLRARLEELAAAWVADENCTASQIECRDELIDVLRTTPATSPQPAPVPAEGEGREPTVAHRWLDDLRLRMEHCVSAAEEGEDYSVSREFLSAMTTLGLMKKVGRGKWAPTDAGSDLANAKPTLPVEIHGKLYEVPIPVQLHIVNLRDKISATPPPEQPAIELEEIRSLARHWRIQDSQIGQGSAGNKARRRCSDELIALIDGAKAGKGE